MLPHTLNAKGEKQRESMHICVHEALDIPCQVQPKVYIKNKGHIKIHSYLSRYSFTGA